MAAKKTAKKSKTTGSKSGNGTTSKQDENKAPSSLSSSTTTMIGVVGIAILSILASGILSSEQFSSSFSSSTGNDTVSSSSSSSSSRTLEEQSASSPASKKNYYPCDEEGLSNFLHEEPVPGMHIICVERTKDNELLLDLYPGSQLDLSKKIKATVDDDETSNNQQKMLRWTSVKSVLVSKLQLKSDPLRQPWALFTSIGERLVGEVDTDTKSDDEVIVGDIVNAGMVILMEGGNWLWPGVRIGYERVIDLYSVIPGAKPRKNEYHPEPRNATLETLSLKPLVLSVKGFLSDDECDHIQELATPKISYSGVVLMDKDKDRPASDFRTSQSTFLGSDTDILYDIDYRTASLVRIPRNQQEYVQVLRYGYTEKYDAHHDFFDPQYYQNDQNTLKNIEYGKKNRLATVFWYLSDVAEGGETNFPRHGGLPQPRDLSKCSQGLMVKPQRGKVIIFYSLKPDGGMDDDSLHAACPVKEGIKWAANKWVWNSQQYYIRD